MMNKRLDYVFVPLRYDQQLLPIPTFQLDTPLEKCLPQQTLPEKFVHWLRNRRFPSRQLLVFVPTVKQIDHIKKLSQRMYALEESETISLESVHAEDL